MTSDRTAQRLARLLAMLPWVIAHQGATVDELCTRFGYTRAELVKDLELVFVCGLPGYGPGELMDATLLGDDVVIEDADYFSRPLRLTAAETLGLLAAGSALLSSSAAPPALATAVDKLRSALVPGDGALAVDLGSEPELVPLLRGAAEAGHVVNLEYTALGSGRTTVRDVEPWSVFSTLGNWYLRAHCRLANDERVFRVDRIRRATPTTEQFQPPGEPGPPDAAYSPSADDVRAVLELGPTAGWVAEYYPVTILEEMGETTVIEFTASDPAVTARLLLRLGTEARLVEGPEAAAATERLRDRILARYR